MKPLVLVYSHDGVFSSVKQETSLLAVRTFDKEGNTLFEELVFDEAYPEKFRELFLDAQAEILPILSEYMKDRPERPDFFELRDLTDDRDFEVVLLLPDDFITAMYKAVDIKINQALISYIVYRWLETKLSAEAAVFKERFEELLSGIKSLLSKRSKPTRINHKWF